MKFLLCVALTLTLFVPEIAFSQSASDPFLVSVYDKLHASPTRDKFRKLAPMPIGCVYIQRPGDGEKEMRAHFRTMKELGFNALKQIMTVPGYTIEQVQLIALEEGIHPFWYGDGGWEDITPALLKKLKINEKLSMDEIRKHPAMVKYQNELTKKRILDIDAYQKKSGRLFTSRSVAYEPEVGPRGFELSEKGKKLFVEWVKANYQTIERLNIAWNMHRSDINPFKDENRMFRDWADFETNWEKMQGREYRHLRDILRFKVEHGLENIKRTHKTFRELDPNGVFRAGGEMGLFYPHAWWCVDMESIAAIVDTGACFYPSMHLAWHYDEVQHEITRPFYMQAAQMQDYFKGNWSAAIEATGGPQQFSGGKGGNGFHVDDAMMTQFILSQLAAGFKGFGLWCWNARDAGWEAGEYALLDRNQKVTSRARKVGAIGKAMVNFRDEIWQLRKEPVVGVYNDWENDAMWAAMTVAGRDSFKMEPIKARIGVSRALINANIPFEYVTAKDLAKGLAGRYKVIYMPSVLSLSPKTMSILSEYVKSGGRLVMDMPGAYYDDYAVLFNTDKGSDFEKTFGAIISEYQYSGVNRTFTINGTKISGFINDFELTSGKAIAYYNDGRPAIIENQYGKGKAVLLGYEASISCFKPNNIAHEKMLISFALGDIKSPYSCSEGIVYRLAGKNADHYFLINDGPQNDFKLQFHGLSYKAAIDAITGEKLSPTGPIRVQGFDGRWIRMEK
jgi:beta-galactosidase